ncbi:Uncharacterised protein [[Clostridium] sordellii]|uniref:DUF4145 domain-containing protein n=1 Tax=Paraclostridium sordellii TaxID=1505 RepID=UPI0005E9A35D|nr:DUF4145 domain-containing protein [Paeniclostridium sordellii]CEN84192.1 Uncharacterised protein [[Clostridium] sordellii] [Paeniclostridium sordellii]CEO09596.1 Uncharacterised protein [[Clostridium] sordellii] [Paeniclostridium sordellii]
MKYIAAEVDLNVFTCPICNAISCQKWNTWNVDISFDQYVLCSHEQNHANKIKALKSDGKIDILKVSTCDACKGYHIWLNGRMIFPTVSSIPVANEDMPESVKNIYNEAREVHSISKKSAAALLRLAVQLLCKELGESGENINKDIASLVSKGLDPSVQKMLDTLRVVGNNAVHPGEIDLDDREDVSTSLFSLLNFIVYEMISKPKKIEEMYNIIPGNLRDAIDRRNERATK